MLGNRQDAARVETVMSFVNTYEVHEDEARVGSPDGLTRWLVEQGRLERDAGREVDAGAVFDGPPTVGRAELDLAHELRSTLRDLLRHGSSSGEVSGRGLGHGAAAHGPATTMPDHGASAAAGAGGGARLDVGAVGQQRVDRLSRQLPLRVVLEPGGQPYLVPGGGVGARSALARVLAAVVSLSPTEWERLKVCPADDCQWLFYDESRNRSRRWCSMEGCGNRSKVRSYRQRAR